MNEVQNELYEASRDDEIVGLYDKELEDSMLKATLQKEAMEQGIKQKACETAIAFYNKNIDINIISECTGLSVEEIKSLVDKCDTK